MSRARIAINVDQASGSLDDLLRLDAGAPQKSIQNLAALLAGIAGGTYNGSVRMTTNAVKASTFGTFTDAPTAADTITINGVVFTARASGAVANEFNISTGGTAAANAAGNAAALAAAINASTSAKIKNQVKATSVLGVITFTATIPGTNGNLFTLAESLGNFTLNATSMAGGTEGTEVICNVGLDV